MMIGVARSAAIPRLARGFASASSANVSLPPFMLHRLDDGFVGGETAVSSEEAMSYFEQMTTVRRLEMASDALYKAKMIRGFCHLYIGQEAICVGMEAALGKGDNIITAYREHGYQYLRSGSLEGVIGELMGRANGCSKGKGGSMHMYDVENGFWGGHGIVGAQVPLGTGLAFAQHYNKEKAVTYAMYGDGAANQGQIFEAMNMAKLWKLPVIYVCENNQYGMGTSTSRAAAESEFYTRGHYVPGIKVNGMNVLAVREACRAAREYAIENGPIVLEMKTYRYQGHSMSDPGTTYRTRDEVQGVRKREDAIDYVKNLILDNGFATEKDLKGIEKAARAKVDAAVEVCKAASWPSDDELYSDVYQGPHGPIRGADLGIQYHPKA